MKFQSTYSLVYGLLIVGCLQLVSCKYTKHLSQNQTLLNENRVDLQTQKPLKYKGETEGVLLSLAQPVTNTHLFDLRFLPKYKLWRYNHHFDLYERDSLNAKILKHKVERPALLDTFQILKSQSFMRQYMENLGYFYATVDYQFEKKGPQRTDVVYRVNAGKNYAIRKVNYVSTVPSLQQVLSDNVKGSVLIPGTAYTAIQCGVERDRLYKVIRNMGYYDFKSDNIIFTIDTTDKDRIKGLLEDPFQQALTYKPETENHLIDVSLHIVKSRDTSYAQLYAINQVHVNIVTPDDEREGNTGLMDTELDNVYFSYRTLPVNRKVITRNLFIHAGDTYNTSDFEITVNRLNQLGVFQFVNIQYNKVEGKPGLLNCEITLNTSPKLDLVGVTDVSTSDEDYLLGTGVGLTFHNRNLFHGANNFSIRTSYSTEFRNDAFLTGSRTFYQSGNNVNLSGNITFPKFIVPINQNVFSKKNMPYTLLGASYSFIRRINNYTIINITGNFGYSWQETQKKNWRVNPIFLTVTQVPPKYLGSDFQKKLETNSFLRNTFTNNVIQGENIVFEYRSKPLHTLSSFQTLKLGVEEAGTLLHGLNTLYTGFTKDTIQAIASYVKAEADFRHYYNRRKSQWVNRFMIGAGVPLRDSRTLPYIKQFSGGGPFSNRGWRSRSLGPGRVVDSTYQSGFVILDQTGDYKLEANSEYRFNLLKLFSGAINLKGAAFVDAGNIWLANKNSNIKGGEFDTRYLWQDIAISSGVGLRLDFSFFVFRVDVGYPIKQPQISAHDGWVINQMKFGSGLWNLALGYPF